MALYFECRINKKALLQTAFLAILRFFCIRVTDKRVAKKNFIFMTNISEN